MKPVPYHSLIYFKNKSSNNQFFHEKYLNFPYEEYACFGPQGIAQTQQQGSKLLMFVAWASTFAQA